MTLSDRETEEPDTEEAVRLRQTIQRLMRQLDDAKNKKAELVEAVRAAAYDAAQGVTLPPVPKPARDQRRRDAEVAIAHMTDWQLAKRTKTYNSDVCAERIERYADKLIKITDIQRADHPVRELRVYLTGDLVEGELIFPGQAHLIDASLYQQVLTNGPTILGGFLRKMALHFDKVHVVGVIGNHGAIGGPARRDMHPESNADTMMYEATRMVLRDEPRITWAPNFTPGERHWYAVDYIGDTGFLLFHGNQVKGGFGGYPWYGFGKKLQGWKMTLDEDWQYAMCGHYHTPVRMYLNGLTMWAGGSTESGNTYAQEQLAAAGEPCQWLLFAGKDGKVTSEHLIHLA